MQDQSIERGANKAKRVNNIGEKYLIRLPEIRFNPGLVPRYKLAEMAKIFYSGAGDKKQKHTGRNGLEAISSILLRVMAEIVKVQQERTN